MSIKHPDDRLDYDVNFTDDLPNDTIFDASATVDPAGLIVDTVDILGLVAKVWLSGGIDGQTYRVSVAAAAESGRIKEKTLVISVRKYT